MALDPGRLLITAARVVPRLPAWLTGGIFAAVAEAAALTRTGGTTQLTPPGGVLVDVAAGSAVPVVSARQLLQVVEPGEELRMLQPPRPVVLGKREPIEHV